MTRLEKTAIALMLVILAAIAVPVFSHLSIQAQLKTNRINLRTVRYNAITSIQTGLGDADSSTPVARTINEGITDRGGWVALAQVDEDNTVTQAKLFVVDDIGAYKSGIAPGKLEQPVPVGSGLPFYPEPAADRISDPFATVTPTSGGNRVYTVQAVISEVDTDLSDLG